MEKSLADILGWEDGEIYEYNNRYYKTKNDRLMVKDTPIGVYDDDYWRYSPLTIDLNLIDLVAEAVPINNNKYYIRHKRLQESFSYLNESLKNGDFIFKDNLPARTWKSTFSNDDIDRIKALGFNFDDLEIVEKR